VQDAVQLLFIIMFVVKTHPT